MSRLKKFLPKGLLWQLSHLNIIVITLTIGICGWAMYHTACFLASGIGGLSSERQHHFNTMLLQYMIVFSTVGIIIGTILHHYLIKKMLRPIQELVESTKLLKKGEFPKPLVNVKHDEVGELIEQFNGLILQLQENEAGRAKIVSDLSHEFRTPLANLTGYLQALQLGDIEGSQALYESLTNEARRLGKMVEQLEQLKEWDMISSRKYISKQFVNIEKEMIKCVEMFTQTSSRLGITIVTHMQPCEVMVNVSGIQQVISNLLDNAISYYKGTDVIKVTGKLLEDVYQVSVLGPSEAISKIDQERIFERFYRVDSSRSRASGGSGLGLAICKEIVEQHRGEIGVNSVNGMNQFWFTIPLH